MLRFFAAVLLIAVTFADPIYVENFDTLDTNDWYIEVMQYPPNNEYEYYTSRTENLKAEGGKLVITPLKENYGGRQYTSGRMYSNFAWKYGRVEVRAKLPKGNGLWPAIWMMSRDEVYGGWPQSGEIDIVEARGQNNHEFASTIHYGLCCGDTVNHFWQSSGDMGTQCNNDEYHVYSVDWTPTQLVYRLDGNAYYQQSLDPAISWMYSAGQPFDQYFHLILNVAIGGAYLDGPDPNTVWNYPDAEMYVDYVKVYPIEDIATYSCVAKSDADPNEICGSVNWACYQQNYADVSAQCTGELQTCCSSPESCDYNTLQRLASAVYSSYDEQVNSDDTCDFSGTAQKNYVLNDGDLGEVPETKCIMRADADAGDMCGSVTWACTSQSYADVSQECSAGNDAISCCYGDPYSCDYNALWTASQNVFMSYYNTLQTPSACDFGGVCYLDNPLVPLACTDGYGA